MGRQFGETLESLVRTCGFTFIIWELWQDFGQKSFTRSLASVLRIIRGENTGPGRNGTEIPVGNSQLGNF